ncbi:MAG TPA: lantibiotic dehydratase [Burkholderiaceae bacterium]
MHFLDDATEHPPVADARPRWPAHLTAPSAAGWALWRDCMLRSAGFPADMLRPLVDESCSQLADRLDEARAMRDAIVREAVACIGARIDAHRGDEAAEGQVRQWQREIKALRRGDVAGALPASLGAPLHERLALAARRCDELQAAWAVSLAAANDAFTAVAARLAADPLFREAVTWQNHAAVTTALDPLAAGAPMSGSKRRQREALVAGYLQRYALKNDTIGFFGPMTWARLVADPREARYDAGSGLVRRRSVRFEDWPIATLAADMARDERLLPWLIPRRQPFLEVQGERLRLPGGGSAALAAGEARLLAACDGRTAAGDIARRLAADPFGEFDDPAEVLDGLRRLERAGRIHLGLQISSCDPRPELALRREFARIGDVALRAELSDRLGLFEAARDEIARSAGDADRLHGAMRRLDTLFDAQTGAGARRRPGEAYGGRGLAYEDCHRDLDVRLGEAALQPLRGALDFVLASSRWYIGQAAARFHDRFAAIVESLSQDAEDVRFADFWLQAQCVLFAEPDIVADLSDSLRERWERVLEPFVSPGRHRCEIASGAIREVMAQAFPADQPAWVMARHQCPDLMFCAESPQALQRGDYLAVLGEVHIGGNTVATNLFVSQHPRPAEMLHALAQDLDAPYVCPKLSPETSRTPIRTQFVEDPDACREIMFSHGLVPANPATALDVAALDVGFGADGRLVARQRGGHWQAPLLDVLGDFLFLRVLNEFGVTRRRRHTPRLTIDRLVVQRERWIFDAAELAALAATPAGDVFLAARRWARTAGLPAQVFVKLTWEDKPFHVDFRSPVLVQMFVRLLHGGAESGRDAGGSVTLTEMLPSADELWLHDAAGRRYTSELRLVCIHRDDVAGATGQDAR